MKTRVLIADDEQLARQRLTRLLGTMEDVEVVGECRDGDEVLARVKQGGLDVVLLDVQMPKLTGTDVISLWPADGPLVIFCTAHAEHAVAAFDAGAVDYVLKPVEPQRLRKALERAMERGAKARFAEGLVKAQGLDRIPVTTRAGVVLVDPAQVTHAVLEDELVTLHTDKASFLTDASLQELQDRLGERVHRVHRRALLNLAAIARLDPLETGGYTARLHSGQSVEISRQAARELRRALGLRKAPDDAE